MSSKLGIPVEFQSEFQMEVKRHNLQLEYFLDAAVILICLICYCWIFLILKETCEALCNCMQNVLFPLVYLLL